MTRGKTAFGPVLARPLSPQSELGLRGLTLYAPHATERINELLGKAPKGRRSPAPSSAPKTRAKSSSTRKRSKSKRGKEGGDKPRKAHSKSKRKGSSSKSPTAMIEVRCASCHASAAVGTGSLPWSCGTSQLVGTADTLFFFSHEFWRRQWRAALATAAVGLGARAVSRIASPHIL